LAWNTEAQGSVPAGASISVEARTANSVASLGLESYIPISNAATGLSLMGQFIQVRVTLRPGVDNISPIFSDLAINTAADTNCDANEDGEINRIDVGIIARHRNVSVPPGNPLFDINGDSFINVIDARLCVLQCTNAHCGISPPP
jgi:hypothetical protein